MTLWPWMKVSVNAVLQNVQFLDAYHALKEIGSVAQKHANMKVFRRNQ